MSRQTAVLVVITALLGCGDELERASELKRFRLFGARIDNSTRRATDPLAAEAAPGETVHVSLRYEDPRGMGRDLRVLWLFCGATARGASALSCAPDAPGFSTALGPEVDYVVPRVEFGIDRNGRARIQAFAMACAGGAIAPGSPLPTCRGEGAESWVLTRSVTVRTEERGPMNHVPEITSVVMYLADTAHAPELVLAADRAVRVSLCTASTCPDYYIEVRTVSGAREVYPLVSNSGELQDTTERIQFGYAATTGVFEQGFYVDTAERPSGPARIRWTPPRVASSVKMVLTSLDPRGGFDSATRDITVE